MSVAADPRLLQIANAHPYPLLFATISGAHLYGFPSPDSDFDLRGVHVLPLREVIGLRAGPGTVERSGAWSGLDLDLVTHDVAKFVRLMTMPNGYVLEQLLSPLVVVTTPAHDELRALGRRCVSRRHVRHYLGFAATQWRLFTKETPRRVKPLLYVYRVLLTGIHLMRTGEVQADLSVLNVDARLPHVETLLAQKRSGPEHGGLDAADLAFHAREYERLVAALNDAAAASTLPEGIDAGVEVDAHEFVVRMRLGHR
ncbi:MAG TPA: nucleotidyltransferase domain-containing protein [Planctomycetota bacterium]